MGDSLLCPLFMLLIKLSEYNQYINIIEARQLTDDEGINQTQFIN